DAVLFDGFVVGYSMHADSCLGVLRVVNKLGQAFLKQVVTSDNEQVGVCDILSGQDQIDVTDRAQFVLVGSGSVINDLEAKFRIRAMVILCPGLEIGGKLRIGDDVNGFNSSDVAKIFDDPFNHRFSGNIEKRLGLLQGEGIKASGVPGGEDQNIHQVGV